MAEEQSNTDRKNGLTQVQSYGAESSFEGITRGESSDALRQTPSLESNDDAAQCRVYKVRYFGLLQLALLNIIVSWDWLTFAPVSTTTSQFFQVSVSDVNWLSTAFLFAFVVATPVVMLTLNRGGPKPAIVAASALLLVGNWIRYGGVKAGDHGSFGVVMFGQIIIGLAQPFVLTAPTRYSDLWFTESGRIAATGVATLANPLGGALGQLIDPAWASKPSDIPNMVLWVAIISTVCTIPSFFVPNKPQIPPTRASTANHAQPSLDMQTLKQLMVNIPFLLFLAAFTIYVAAFNALSSLLNSILYPYDFTEDEAGITGALLILVGLASAAIFSPILDRRPHWRIPLVKVLVPIISFMYLAWIFVPGTRSVAGPYAVSAILGAASFALVPLALELVVDVTYPISPEISSVLCWVGGQLVGGIFIVVMDALRGSWHSGEPPENMKAGLVFQAVCCLLVFPLPMLIGYSFVGGMWKGRTINLDERTTAR